MSKRKKTHDYEDQFGEHRSQDREEHMHLGKGSRGGGTAGKQARNSTNLNFQRHVPKFLQPYAHMLGHKPQDQDEPQMAMLEQLASHPAGDDDDDDDEDKAAEEEAIQRALEENPELALELGPEYMQKVEAAQEKELGNKAFAAKDYSKALTHFTRCIELDPKNAIFYSNRSAAAANLLRFEDALSDAKTVLRLKPGWVKGHARAAAAYMGLQLYSEAKEQYEKAVKLEPDDKSLQASLNKAIALELQHIRENKHVFKKSRGNQQQQQRRQHQQGSKGSETAAVSKDHKPNKTGAKLSFLQDEDDEG